MRAFRFSYAVWALAVLSCGIAVAQNAVTLTPPMLEPGSPVLIHVNAPATATLSGEWMGQKLSFFHAKAGRGWFALAGIDVEGAVGPSILRISSRRKDGAIRDLSRTVEINAANYRTETLTVAPEFVEPPAEKLPEIKAEEELKTRIFSSSSAEPLWTGNFRAPVTARPTDNFGTRRTFNGELESVHKGIDFLTRTGTPVRAGNSGVVVLARELYYEGNCVVIDHGLGLFTISMHLSRIDVHEGQRVRKGQLLGLSGAMGRVTGPHLHWGGGGRTRISIRQSCCG